MNVLLLFGLSVFIGLFLIGLFFFIFRIIRNKHLQNNALPKLKSQNYKYFTKDPITEKVNEVDIDNLESEQQEIKKKVGFFGNKKQEKKADVKPNQLSEEELYKKFMARYEAQKEQEEQEKRLKQIEEERKRIEQERIKELERQEKEKAYIEMRNRILEEIKQKEQIKEPVKEEPKKYYSDSPFKIEDNKQDEPKNN